MTTRETVQIPLMHEGMADGKLVRWLVSSGDYVEMGQPIFVLETPEALYEVQTFGPGIITLSAEEGVVYPVGHDLGSVEIREEDRVDFEIVGVRLSHAQRLYIDSVRGDLDRRTWIHKKVKELFERETK
jgi:pyruvate/2-oxoglutarate dehydrogenase complex dihydrolipoamide acyltransferase (E2) component